MAYRVFLLIKLANIKDFSNLNMIGNIQFKRTQIKILSLIAKFGISSPSRSSEFLSRNVVGLKTKQNKAINKSNSFQN